MLTTGKVDIAVSALARACCESSARAAAVLDPNVDSLTRVSRALNDALHSLPADSAAVSGSDDGTLLTTARQLSIEVRVGKGGRITQFGSEPRLPMTALTREYLRRQVEVPGEIFDPVWRMWNGAAHGGLDAGLGLGFGGGANGFAQMRAGVALTAWAACGLAQARTLAYTGLPGLGSALPE